MCVYVCVYIYIYISFIVLSSLGLKKDPKQHMKVGVRLRAAL